MVAIGDVVEDVKSWNPASLPQPVPIRYIDLSAVDKDAKSVVPHLVVEVLSNAAPSRARQLVVTEDVLVSTVRPNLNGVALLDEALDGATASTGYCVLRSNRKKLEPKYLRYWVETTAFVDEMTRLATGASYPAVSDAIIKNSKIPLPPLPEQRRIAAILDKAQALVANDKRTLAVYDQLAKSLFLEMFGDPVRNERGWEVVEFGDVVEAIENGWSPNCESYPRSSADERAVLKLGSVTYRQFNANENKVLPDTEAGRPDLEVQAGDLLITRKNTKELVGAAAYVFETAPRLMIPDLIFRILTRANKVEKLFLWMLLNEDGFQKNVQQLASGSASSMPNISKAKLMALPIPLPPLRAQQKFAKAALLLRERRTGIETSIRQSEALFGSLLQGAFSGNL